MNEIWRHKKANWTIPLSRPFCVCVDPPSQATKKRRLNTSAAEARTNKLNQSSN
jgi:hypothetical protein